MNEHVLDADIAPVIETERRVPWRRNPIFNRELMTLLRSNRAFAFLAVYAVLSVAMVLLSWPRDPEGIRVAGDISRGLFRLFAIGQSILLGLLVPAALAGTVTREKENETLDLLLVTPLTGMQIVLGKLLSGMSYLMLLLLTSTPALLLCYLIGGMGWEDVVGLYVFLAAQTFLYGAISVFCSVSVHRTHYAIILSYLVVGATGLVQWAIYGDGIGYLMSRSMWVQVALVGLLSMAFVRSGVRRIRREYTPVRKAMEEEDVSRQVGLVIRRDKFPDRLIAPPRRRDLLADGADPVLDKELQAEVYGSGSLFVRLVVQFGVAASLVTMIGCIVSIILNQQGGDIVHPEYPYLCFLISYILVVAPSFATNAFTQEKETRMMDSLLLTLLPRWRIVWGKFLAMARVVGILALLNSLCMIILVVLSSRNWEQLPTLVVTGTTSMILALSVGMALSLYCRTTTTATIATYFTLFGLFVGPSLLKMFLTQFFPTIEVGRFMALDVVSPYLACYRGGSVSALAGKMALHSAFAVGMSGLLLFWMMSRFEATLRKQAEQAG